MSNPDKHHVVTLEINGTRRTVAVEARKLLVHLISDDLGLTGTHVGCDTSQCGACTVEIDGQAVKSCTVLAVMADGSSITTIEGLADPATATLHPIQAAFHEHHALQCGFCTPGMIMACASCSEQPSSERERHPSRPRRQHLPLHRLHQHRARRRIPRLGGASS